MMDTLTATMEYAEYQERFWETCLLCKHKNQSITGSFEHSWTHSLSERKAWAEKHRA